MQGLGFRDAKGPNFYVHSTAFVHSLRPLLELNVSTQKL